MPFVYSTLTSDNRYTNYQTAGADLKIPEKGILIKGGTGIANDRLITPIGVPTEVTKEQLEALEKNPVFQKHKENGFIVVQDKSAEVEKVVSDMKTQDNSAPLTPSNYKTKKEATDLSVTTNKK